MPAKSTSTSSTIRLSIVIPTGPGEHAWQRLLADLDLARRSCSPAATGIETIVSACTPRPDLSPGPNAVWVEGPPGRAAQMNRGIAAARGEAVWLLHADSRVKTETLKAAWEFTRECPAAVGWFTLAFADDGPAMTRLNAAGANLRSRWLGLPFGDQGLLAPREVFIRLGGFDEGFGRGEDLEFIVRARRCGIPTRPVRARLITSARRYREQGWVRTTFSHLGLTLRLLRKARGRARDD